MALTLDTLVSLCKRRGIVFQSSEIYGGTGSVWDYGPLGVEMKNHIKRLWWRDVVQRRDEIVGLDAGILMHPKTWEASGHLEHFTDPMVDCRACKARHRYDEIVPDDAQGAGLEGGTTRVLVKRFGPWFPGSGIALAHFRIEGPEEEIRALAPPKVLEPEGVELTLPRPPPWKAWPTSDGTFRREGRYYCCFSVPEQFLEEGRPVRYEFLGTLFDLQPRPYRCPRCGGSDLTEPRQFNLMFKTFMGPVEDASSVVYLRPETAQGIFVNFENVLQATRKKLPFGIAQIGKAFRNEITPGHFIFRTREFEQMEIEYFVRPGTDEEVHQNWIDERLAWYRRYGIRKENLSLYEHPEEKLSHYSKRTVDIMYRFPNGVAELEGIANRTDFDLLQHSKHSGRSLTYFDEASGQHITPYVIEPSAGVDRVFLAFLCDAYTEEQVRREKRTVLKLHPELAPIKVAVLPLLKKRGDIVERARGLAAALRENVTAVYDDTASIGRLYRRQDEVGTPLCVTVDVETVEKDNKVTIRERDSMDQVRVPIDRAEEACTKVLRGNWEALAREVGVWKRGTG